MKNLKLVALVAISLFLIAGISCAQTAKEYYDKGIEYGAEGKIEEAEKEFKKALGVDQSFVGAVRVLRIAELALEKKIEGEAIAHFFKGAIFLNKEKFNEASSEYKTAINISPNFAQAYLNLGFVYYVQGGLEAAISEYKKALAIDPNYGLAHSNLGLAYYNKGMLDEANSEYKKAISMDANCLEAYLNLGLLYKGKGMLDEAISEYKKAITINPNFAEAHNNLASAYYSKGQYDLAIKHCDRAIELGFKVHPGMLKALKPYRK